MRKIPPPKNEPINKKRWSGPIINLMKCGITRPTNPITPATATQIPVKSDAIKNKILIVTLLSTPKCPAFASPSISAFSGRAKK